MQSKNFHEKTFRTICLPKQGCYKWEIIDFMFCDVIDKNHKSPNFYPLGSENEWFLSLEKRWKNLSVQFHSLKETDCFVTLEFFLNGERLSDLLSGRVCGDYNIGTINTTNPFLLKMYKVSYGTLRVIWTWENMDCDATNLYQELQSNFHSLLKSGNFSDLIIETQDGSKTPVHRAILSARSPVFCAMLENNMLEAKTPCIEITDFSSETVKQMIKYMYTSETPVYSFDSATDLLRIASKFDLSSLKSACAQILIANLSENNAIQLLLLADMHSADGLKEKALDFISENQSHFADHDKLQLLLKQRPALLLDVTISIMKS